MQVDTTLSGSQYGWLWLKVTLHFSKILNSDYQQKTHSQPVRKKVPADDVGVSHRKQVIQGAGAQSGAWKVIS